MCVCVCECVCVWMCVSECVCLCVNVWVNVCVNMCFLCRVCSLGTCHLFCSVWTCVKLVLYALPLLPSADTSNSTIPTHTLTHSHTYTHRDAERHTASSSYTHRSTNTHSHQLETTAGINKCLKHSTIAFTSVLYIRFCGKELQEQWWFLNFTLNYLYRIFHFLSLLLT